jgi:hypothetical protein
MVGIITTHSPCRTLDYWLVALKPWYIQSLIGSVFAPWRTVIHWLSQLANKSAIYLLYGCARTMCSNHVFDIVEFFGAVTMSITTVESVYTLIGALWSNVNSARRSWHHMMCFTKWTILLYYGWVFDESNLSRVSSLCSLCWRQVVEYLSCFVTVKSYAVTIDSVSIAKCECRVWLNAITSDSWYGWTCRLYQVIVQTT